MSNGKLTPRQFGKYLLLDRIGMGGMAEIWRARQFGAAGFQKDLVIKKILQHLSDNDEFVRMFIDEAKIAVSLQHANVVQIFDLGAVQQEYFIAMEYVFGRDLLNLLIRCTHLRIRVPQKLAVFFIAETLKGLEAAHAATDARGAPLGIIHRDVSPSNVLISYDGDVKLSDFGVAKAAKQQSGTRSGAMKGKLGYMSPEQVIGDVVDHRADLFSAGIVLYEMLAMNRLFHGKTELETLMMVRDAEVAQPIANLPASVPQTLRDVLLRALSPADQRYQSASEFLEALFDYLFGQQVRVTNQDASRFMKSVFAKELEEDLQRIDEIDAALNRGDFDTQTGPPTRDRPPSSVPPRDEDHTSAWQPDSHFRIRDSEGVVYGPMGLNTLVDIVRRDGLAAAEEISIDDASWVPAGVLQGLLATAEDAVPAPPRRSPDFKGGFRRVDFPRLLYRYAICKATGRMHLKSGTKHKELFFRKGRPEYVTSNLRGELLGEYLVDHRIITRTQLTEALAIISEHGGRLGDALLYLKSLTTHELINALSAQVKAKLIEIFGWEGGQYAFFRGETTTAQIMPLQIAAFPLINEGVTRRFALDDIKGYFNAIDHLPFYLTDHKRISSEQLQLTTKQHRIWNAVQHGTPVTEQLGRLQAIPGVHEADVYQVLFLMERLDFATIGQALVDTI